MQLHCFGSMLGQSGSFGPYVIIRLHEFITLFRGLSSFTKLHIEKRLHSLEGITGFRVFSA